MPYTTGDNNFGVAKWIVDSTAGHGTHTTIASALTSASSGDTIFIRPGTYTENLTLKVGVNLTAFICDATTPNVTIVGTCTLTAAGTVSISGIRLQTNSAFALAVTGSAASIVKLTNCYINATNNTAISFSSSSGSSEIDMYNCLGNIATTGITLVSSSAAGMFRTIGCQFLNTGASTTASTFSDGSFFPESSSFAIPFTISGTTAVFSAFHSSFNNAPTNTTSITFNSTAAAGGSANLCAIVSGTSSALSVGAGATFLLSSSDVSSSNANAVTGAGTVLYNTVNFSSTSSTINTTTQTALVARHGITRSTLQPAFSATHSVAQNNVTGNGTVATVNFTTEIFDQNSNYDGTNTFTAPLTGKYHFNAGLLINDAATSTFAVLTLTTSNRNYVGNVATPFPLGTVDQYDLVVGALADMDAADTCTVTGAAFGMAGATADFPAGVTQTYFNGSLVC